MLLDVDDEGNLREEINAMGKIVNVMFRDIEEPVEVLDDTMATHTIRKKVKVARSASADDLRDFPHSESEIKAFGKLYLKLNNKAIRRKFPLENQRHTRAYT